MNKPIVISGTMGAGKTTLANMLVKDGYERIVTYTTRPPREGEIDGVDYHFITMDDFKQRFIEDFFAEVAVYDAYFGRCMYGSAIKDYKPNSLVVMNGKGVMQLNNTLDFHHIHIEPKEETVIKRLRLRGDDMQEVHRRLWDDKQVFDLMMVARKPDLHIKTTGHPIQLRMRVLKHLKKEGLHE